MGAPLANGNATSATVRGVTSAGAFDAQDRMTSLGGATYDWTAQGELAAKHEGANTTTYSTDSLGRLQSVTLPSGHTVSYVYDGSNRRVGKKVDGTLVQGFLYQGALKPVVELDGAGSVVSRFVYGSSPLVPDYVIRGGSTYRIFSDQIGSPRVVVDASSGAVVERIDYDERGNVLKDTNAGLIPFGFAGGIVDRDTGFVRFGARDYDPQSGRWTEKDPLGLVASANLYVFAEADMVNRLDPTGLWGMDSSQADAYGQYMATQATPEEQSRALWEFGAATAIGVTGGLMIEGALADVGVSSVTVTQWAPAGASPTFSAGSWVQIGEANALNYVRSGVVELGYPIENAVTREVAASSLRWPSGWEFLKGLLGQRQIAGMFLPGFLGGIDALLSGCDHNP